MEKDSTFFKPTPRPQPQLAQDEDQQNRKRALIYLIVSSVVCVVVINFVPYGFYILYPFYIMSTWFHEMGHSLTAMAFGSWYNPITINLDGGGLTYHHTQGRIAQALVAAGGLLGTPIVGGILILFGKTGKRSKMGLYILSVLVLVSAGILMMIPSLVSLETIIGFAMVVVMGIGIFFVAKKGKPKLQQFVIQFLGASAGLFTITRADYLFVREIGGDPNRISDVGHIADLLFLPYWFWGGLIFAISIIIMGFSLYLAFRKKKKEPEPASV